MSVVGKRCGIEQAYGGWRDVDHEPLIKADGEPFEVLAVSEPLTGNGPPEGRSDNDETHFRVCTRCGCVYLEEARETTPDAGDA